MKENNEKVLKGADGFKLYDTFGFPMELTKEILEDEGLSLDEDAFHEEMKIQRDRARSARKTSNYMGADVNISDEIPKEIETVFDGYDNDILSAEVKVLIEGDNVLSDNSFENTENTLNESEKEVLSSSDEQQIYENHHDYTNYQQEENKKNQKDNLICPRGG